MIMKRNIVIYGFIAAALALVGCSKQQDSFENKLFVNANSYRNEVRVATDEGVKTLNRSVELGIAQPMSNDIHVNFVKSPELLDIYRRAYYDPEVELLPENVCDLSGVEAVIRAGDVASKPVTLTFNGLDKLDYTKSYVLPVSIKSDGIEVLNSSRTLYYVVKEASLVNCVAELKSNRAWPVWDNFDKVKNLETFTMEALINCHAFNNDSKIETVMGVEDHFLIRIGDVTIPSNQIQIAVAYKDVEGGSTYRRDVTDAALQLRTDRWYHIAVTFDKGNVKVYLDGRLRAQNDISAIGNRPGKDGNLETVYFKSVDFGAAHSEEDDGKPRCFWVGYSYNQDRFLDGMIAEARLWNKVLTVEEINKPNHFYKLYADEIDESLLAYWKFSDGTGKSVKDWSIYGNNLTAEQELIWYPVSLPTK